MGGRVWRISTLNDGRWGNAGETDDQVFRYCAALARLLGDAFPGLGIRLVRDDVPNQFGVSEEEAEEIRGWINEHYFDAIDAVEAHQ